MGPAAQALQAVPLFRPFRVLMTSKLVPLQVARNMSLSTCLPFMTARPEAVMNASPSEAAMSFFMSPPPAFSNNHLGYAITWFGLALGLVGVYVAMLRLRRQKDPS